MDSLTAILFLSGLIAHVESEICFRYKTNDGSNWIQIGTNLRQVINGVVGNAIEVQQTCANIELSNKNDIYRKYNSTTYAMQLCSEQKGVNSMIGNPANLEPLLFESATACASYALLRRQEIVSQVQHDVDGGCTIYSPSKTAITQTIPETSTTCDLSPIKICQDNDFQSGTSYQASTFAECYNIIYRQNHFNFAGFKSTNEQTTECYGLSLNELNFRYSSTCSDNAPVIYYVLRNNYDSCSHNLCSAGQCVFGITNHRCICPEGFILHEEGNECIDINECESNTIECVNGECINNSGSYTCECQSGYELKQGSNTECKDRDECAEKIDECQTSNCVNTEGSYTCACDEGYSLATDGVNCEDRDECADGSNTCVNAECENTLGSYNCRCNVGYKLKEGSDRECVDINECSERLYNCTDNSDCINIAGSYKCECQEGYSLNDDKQCLNQKLSTGDTIGIVAACLAGTSAIIGGICWGLKTQRKQSQYKSYPTSL